MLCRLTLLGTICLLAACRGPVAATAPEDDAALADSLVEADTATEDAADADDATTDAATPVDVQPPGPVLEGVTLLAPWQTLYKASLQIAGRPPTAAESAAVDAGGLDALDAILTAQMQEPAFEERLREIFADVLLTDGFRANNTTDSTSNLIRSDYFPSGSVNYWGGENWAWRSWPNGEGIRLVEALAREPVEFVIEAHRKGLPLSHIVTAKHRLLNAYSARFFKVPYKGFAPGTPFDQIPDPQAYEAVDHVPVLNEQNGSGEYAGILTTTAFLLRYPSSPTNFNRKRARFTYKYFLDFDIMKAAPRIDASAVDLNDTPTFKNPQCTGCHSQIDPVAGAFMNEDECGYEFAVFYQPPGSKKNGACSDNGWVPGDKMFAPGVAIGAKNAIALADRPHALELLGAYIAQQPDFTASMVNIVYTGLMGRKPLAAPTDPTQQGYAAAKAAADDEAARLAGFSQTFQAKGLLLAPLVIAIVKSPAFRAAAADKAGRQELVGLGGGTLTTPENLHRKIRATTGVLWQEHGADVASNSGYQRLGRHDGSGDAYLLLREELKTLYGGMDGSFQGVKARQSQASTLTAAIVEHMALEVACLATARDFDRAVANRTLFPAVALTDVPGPDPKAANQAAILQTIRDLHARLLGERLALDDPELLASHALLYKLHTDGLAKIQAKTETAALERPCAADIDIATGQVHAGTKQDPQFVIRAWQGLLAYLLMDYRFVFEH